MKKSSSDNPGSSNPASSNSTPGKKQSSAPSPSPQLYPVPVSKRALNPSSLSNLTGGSSSQVGTRNSNSSNVYASVDLGRDGKPLVPSGHSNSSKQSHPSKPSGSAKKKQKEGKQPKPQGLSSNKKNTLAKEPVKPKIIFTKASVAENQWISGSDNNATSSSDAKAFTDTVVDDSDDDSDEILYTPKVNDSDKANASGSDNDNDDDDDEVIIQNIKDEADRLTKSLAESDTVETDASKANQSDYHDTDVINKLREQLKQSTSARMKDNQQYKKKMQTLEKKINKQAKEIDSLKKKLTESEKKSKEMQKLLSKQVDTMAYQAQLLQQQQEALISNASGMAPLGMQRINNSSASTITSTSNKRSSQSKASNLNGTSSIPIPTQRVQSEAAKELAAAVASRVGKSTSTSVSPNEKRFTENNFDASASNDSDLDDVFQNLTVHSKDS